MYDFPTGPHQHSENKELLGQAQFLDLLHQVHQTEICLSIISLSFSLSLSFDLHSEAWEVEKNKCIIICVCLFIKHVASELSHNFSRAAIKSTLTISDARSPKYK
jgi:hypothetical protein